MRELMFRQEQKAKRIAKIKSKTYRKIHKREREREMERQAAEEGSDDEKRMKLETARAKERMTLRHKTTGEWAKRILGRKQHDPETRQEILEHIRRRDDLQQKMLGHDDESGKESDGGEELEELLHDPNEWGETQAPEDAPEIRKGVMGMKFMRDAEERQRQANAQQIAEIKAAFNAGSDEDEVSTSEQNARELNPGRKSFTPGDQV
jgi:U3 small nucleolar RNA-associated protein 14